MTIHCNGTPIDCKSPKVMGILNVTPDSFYDGGKFNNQAQIVLQVKNILDQGATFIDVGGYSSRPGAENVSEEEELNRVIPVIELIVEKFPKAIISIDTFRSRVARNAIASGASIVNDISAGSLDAAMMDTVAELKVPYIMMHMQGTPQTMQDQPKYNHIVLEIADFFKKKLEKATLLGIKELIIDPGFGFGKTVAHNYEILQNLSNLTAFGVPVLAGVSRKSMIYKPLNTSPEEALNGTTALHMAALMNGAGVLRVHDVKEAFETIILFNKLQSS